MQSYTARFVSDRPENKISKGEKIDFQYFLPFPIMISNLIFTRALIIGNSLAKEFLAEQQGWLLSQTIKT